MKKYILLFLTAFVFTSGGCGGSSTSSLQADSPTEEDDAITVSAPFDSDSDGVPDAFGYYPEGWSSGKDDPADGEAYTVPYLNYIDSSDADIDGSFTARIHLTQGNEYIISYSHSGRPLTENYVDFTIFTPDHNELTFDFGFEIDSAEQPAAETQKAESITVSSDEVIVPPEGEEEYTSEDSGDVYGHVTVSASIDILPPENPCVISYKFTAPQTGVYEFTFRELEYSPVSYDLPYELRIYRSDDDSMSKLGNITLTPRELLDLQRVLLSYADKYNADGLPESFRPEFDSEDVYMNLLQYFAEENLTASGMRAAADEGAYIKPVVYNVPYDAEFKEGVGFYASSGLAALNESAFANFVLPTPQTGGDLPTAAEFKVDEILTEEEHNREQELEEMSTFALCKNALGDREMTVTNVRLGQSSKSVIIKYDLLEFHPRMADVKSADFSSDAMSLLNSNYKQFREEFGDYFVAGYRWGKSFRAVISVTCEDRAILDSVCIKIKNIASQAQLGTDKSFSEQMKTVTMNDYVRLKACFRRFREVQGVKNLIPAYLPIYQNHFNAIVEMNKTIFRTRCRYNAIISIHEKHLVDAATKKHEWESEFNDLVDSVKSQLNAICANQTRIEYYRSQFQRLHDKYRAFCERYCILPKAYDCADNTAQRLQQHNI